MSDYYAILGVPKNATSSEIKVAFRKLAKEFHPDKNPSPQAKSVFESILKAYNVLINVHSRRRYDEGFFHKAASQVRYKKGNENTKTKEWSFTDEELRRRQYYQTYYKTKQKEKQEQEPTKVYSDYKYILFATPLAVALLMFVFSFFTEDPVILNKQNVVIANPQTEPVKIAIQNGDTPYSGFFGNIKTVNTDYSLKINNTSNHDVVIVILDALTDEYLQHAFIEKSYYMLFSLLPTNGVYYKMVMGDNWNSNLILFNNKVNGSFDSLIQYQNWKSNPILFNKKNKNIERDLFDISDKSKDKKYISNDIEFFAK
jgi:curved DNA-binding protein CbpA